MKEGPIHSTESRKLDDTGHPKMETKRRCPRFPWTLANPAEKQDFFLIGAKEDDHAATGNRILIWRQGVVPKNIDGIV